MKIYETIGLNLEKQNIISLVGAGGKSTSMNILAKELKEIGKKVLVTTTTMIFLPDHKKNNRFILGELPREYKPKEGSITLLGKSIKNEKITGLSIEEIKEIYEKEIFDIILIEADGAKKKPIKAAADHEPVVPNFSTITLGVIGLDSLGKPLNEENVHRPEILKDIINVELNHILDVKNLVSLVLKEEGLFKNSYGRKIIFLNKAYNQELILLGKQICRELYDIGLKDVYITDIKNHLILTN